MNIVLAKKTRKFPLKNRELLLKISKSITENSGLNKILPSMKTELVVILVDDQQIAEINQNFLNHQGPTDVISFDYTKDFDAKTFFPGEVYTVGELYISIETADRQRVEYNNSLNDEVLLYIIHGILHLCGYDDHKPNDIKKMRNAEKENLEKIKAIFGNVEIIWLHQF